jgi:hypothetical protein
MRYFNRTTGFINLLSPTRHYHYIVGQVRNLANQQLSDFATPQISNSTTPQLRNLTNPQFRKPA